MSYKKIKDKQLQDTENYILKKRISDLKNRKNAIEICQLKIKKDLEDCRSFLNEGMGNRQLTLHFLAEKCYREAELKTLTTTLSQLDELSEEISRESMNLYNALNREVADVSSGVVLSDRP